MTRKLKHPRQVNPALQMRLQFLIVFLIVRIQLGITLQRRLINVHRQRLDIPQRLQLYHLRLIGKSHMFRHIGHKTRTDHVTFHVTQPVDTLPRAPLLQ